MKSETSMLSLGSRSFQKSAEYEKTLDKILKVCNMDSESGAPWMLGCSLIRRWDVSSLSPQKISYQLCPLQSRDALAAEEPYSDFSVFWFEQDYSSNFPNCLVRFHLLSSLIALLPSYSNFTGTTQRNSSCFQVQIFGHLITICIKAKYMCWQREMSVKNRKQFEGYSPCFKAVSSPGF